MIHQSLARAVKEPKIELGAGEDDKDSNALLQAPARKCQIHADAGSLTWSPTR